MTVVRISAGTFIVEIETDSELHPDLLDELCVRAVRLFSDVQAGLPEEGDT